MGLGMRLIEMLCMNQCLRTFKYRILSTYAKILTTDVSSHMYTIQITHPVVVHPLDKEVTQYYSMVWHVLGQSLTSLSVATEVTFTAAVTVRMLELCAQ